MCLPNPWLATGASVFLTFCVAAQQAPAPRLDAELRAATVAGIGKTLTERYVFADKGAECATLLKKRLDAGAYDGFDSPFAFATALTEDLQGLTADTHLRVRVRRSPPPQKDRPSRAVMRERMLRQFSRRNYGFEKVERLTGNVGYIDLRGFMETGDAGATAVAAMAFLAHADAFIIDLRKNGGGSPTMIQLLSSYFFDEATHLNSFFWRGKDQIDQFWTLPHVEGVRHPDAPLYILTSGQTFSAAEEFTYNMKNLKRATIVGATTGGGAHPGGTIPVNQVFAVWVPQGRAINPVSGTNWEGTGIEPDIATETSKALLVAHQHALETIAKKEADPAVAAKLRWDMATLKARIQPAVVAPKQLARLVGVYGPRAITLDDGVLYYQREGRSRTALVALSHAVFMPEGLDHFRVRFEEENGEIVRLVGLYDDGREEPSARTDG